MQTCYLTQLSSCEYYDKQDSGVCSASVSPGDGVIFEFASEQSTSTDTLDLLSLEEVEHTQRTLDNALEVNRQLHVTLQKKQEEISALKEKNAQLKALARQAEHFASILEILTPSPQRDCPSASDSGSTETPSTHSTATSNIEQTDWLSTASKHSEKPDWLSSVLTHTEHVDWLYTGHSHCSNTEAEHPQTGAQRQLWTSQHDSVDTNLGKYPDDSILGPHENAKRPKLDQELFQVDLEQLSRELEQAEWDSRESKPDSAPSLNHQNLSQSQDPSTSGQTTEMINVFGAFHGLQVVTAAPSASSAPAGSGGAGEGMCFKTSVRDHSTIRTRVFPHGKSFTSHTSSGGCRFLWVPIQN